MRPVPQALAIGCSAGGLTALHQLFGGLRGPLPVAVVVVCHTGSEDMAVFCELLQRTCPMPVAEAVERESPRRGHVHVAPAGYHLLVERDRRFALSIDPRVEFSRPSIDVLFESAAEAWQQHLVGVLLTGANADGAQGLRHIRRSGGVAVVEDPATAFASAMPTAALEIAGADHCVSLPAMPKLLESLCQP